jgi:YidC/Oxa1 family membrane protein insertase
MEGESGMSVEKRMIVAVIISAVVIVVWNILFAPLPVEETPAQPSQEESTTTGEKPAVEPGAAEAPTEEQEQQPAPTGMPEELITAGERQSVSIESPLFKVELSNDWGGSVSSWQLKDFRASFSDNTLDLVAPARYRPEGLLPLATMIRSGESKYAQIAARPVLRLEGGEQGGTIKVEGDAAVTVTFELNDESLGWLRKKLTFHADSYLVDVEFVSELKSGEAVLVWGPGVGELLKPDGAKLVKGMEGNGFLYRKVGGQVQRVQAPVSDKGEAGEPFKEQSVPEIVEWVGLENRYFMALADGDIDNLFKRVYLLTASKQLDDAEGSPTFYFPYVGIRPENNSASFRLFVGPKDLGVLEDPRYGNLKDVVQFGWFAFVSRPALWLMQQIEGVIGNYGWAIIILTVLINTLLLPLIIKQRRSMGEMQRVQPQIKQIQAKYRVEKGDNIETRQRKKRELNEEMMALYKVEGINPMGGCLPLLLQIPILFALFDMFRVAIELRQAPFIFWITDLSGPDPTYITPILMGVAMYFSQMLTPTSAEAGGATMKLLPFIFVIFFAAAPSGLVIYWLTSSLYNMGVQAAMNRVSPPPAADKRKGVPAKAGRKSKKGRR